MSGDESIKLGHVAARALALLQGHPEGLSMAQLHEMLGETHEDQEHFNRRIRENRTLCELPKQKKDGAWVYVPGSEQVAG